MHKFIECNEHEALAKPSFIITMRIASKAQLNGLKPKTIDAYSGAIRCIGVYLGLTRGGMLNNNRCL